MSNIKKISALLIGLAVLAIAVFVIYKEVPAGRTAQKETAFDITIPKEAREAAEKGLPDFLQRMSSTEINDFGFSSQEELHKASLGKPLRSYAIMPQAIQDYKEDEPIESIMSPIGMIYFPVVSSDNTVHTMLLVTLRDNSWKASEIGGSKFAEAMNLIQSNWPSSEGYDYSFVILPSPRVSFVFIKQKPAQHSINLSFSETSFVLYDDKIYTPSDLLKQFKRSTQP